MQDTEARDLKIYEVLSTATGEKSFQVATDAQEACREAGWPVNDCEVHPLVYERRAAPGQHIELRVKIPCHTCPYQYADCTKPLDTYCPVKPQAPELAEWLKQASAAHLCSYQGDALTKKDHELKQKWVTIPEAIQELASQHLSDVLDSPQ